MKTDIAIIGAGIAGAATAYHLRRLGVGDLVLLEQESTPGQHSTARNAAMVREHDADPDLDKFTREGANALRSGEYCDFRRCGGMLLGSGDDDVSTVFPLATGRGRWNPNDGVCDPAGLLQSYLRGQRVVCGTRVIGMECDRRGGMKLTTSTGAVAAQRVINAAGPWAGVLADLPLEPRNRHLYVTPGMAAVDASWPFVWDLDAGVYFRPESGGLLLCPCDEATRAPGDYRIDESVQARLAGLLATTQPGLANVAIKTCWTGQRTFAADGKFVIGPDPRWPELFHVCGLGGHGVSTSYGVGRFAAELILGMHRGKQNPFDPARLLAPDSAHGENAICNAR